MAHILVLDSKWLNLPLAISYLKDGIRERLPSALSLMGYLYYKGLGVKVNIKLSLLMFRKSAE